MEKVLSILGYKLETMPGIDTVTAAAIIAEIVDDTRFATPDKLARILGIAPVNFSSAGKGTDQKNHTGKRTTGANPNMHLVSKRNLSPMEKVMGIVLEMAMVLPQRKMETQLVLLNCAQMLQSISTMVCPPI